MVEDGNPADRSASTPESDESWAMLVLRETPGLGPVRIRNLLEAEGDGAPKTARSVLAELGDTNGSRSRTLRRGRVEDRAAVEDRAERILASSRRHGVSVVPLTAPDYPPALAKIHDPPPVLFVRGVLPRPILEDWSALRAVAVVGTRDPTARARRWAEEVGRDLARAGIVVVSGLARGVDGAAHEGAVNAASVPAVAVLAGGLDVVRPAVHRRLAERILERGGALVSEDPPGSRAHPHDFVARNRIVSGLSRSVVVVEAGSRSGALHTADFALEQGRALFVVPDHPTSTRAHGNLRLLGEGAIPVMGVENILDHHGWGGPPAARDVVGSDRAWLERVAERAPCAVDALGRDPIEATIALSRLELEGWLDRDGSGRYRLTTAGRRAVASEA